MGTALLKIKIMPDSPNADLNTIQEKATTTITENKGINPKFETEPVAFGLNAIIASFSIDEETPTDPLEEGLSQIESVSSAQIIDFRRALE